MSFINFGFFLEGWFLGVGGMGGGVILKWTRYEQSK